MEKQLNIGNEDVGENSKFLAKQEIQKIPEIGDFFIGG